LPKYPKANKIPKSEENIEKRLDDLLLDSDDSDD